MKITVVGMGYVGLANAVALAEHNQVVLLEVNRDKVNNFNKKTLPIEDDLMQQKICSATLSIYATTDVSEAYVDSQYVIIATPTDYDEENNWFNTETIKSVLADVGENNPDAIVVIKSTIPVGYINKIRQNFPRIKTIFFSPEFLREGRALLDSYYPSRIVVGTHQKEGRSYADLMLSSAKRSDVPVIFTGSEEAEAIKLFANSYLAMRVAFFNELDSFAYAKKLNTEEIIEGVCHDDRIGMGYNNPSFGFGGYCLPKDAKQLLATFEGTPQSLVSSITDSNRVRKEYMATCILNGIKEGDLVGIYRLAMKVGSDNFRESAVFELITSLKRNKVDVYIYEPSITSDTYETFPVIKDVKNFKQKVDWIIANRKDEELEDVNYKVFTRDVFSEN